MPTVSTPSSRPGMVLVSVPVRSSTGGIYTAGAAGGVSAGVVSALSPPPVVVSFPDADVSPQEATDVSIAARRRKAVILVFFMFQISPDKLLL